jgi:hypothetical protein
MTYINNNESIRRHVEILQKLNEAFVRSRGHLKVTLTNGRIVKGRYYGAQCTTNDRSKLVFHAEIGNEKSDFPGVYDLLDILTVEPVGPN